MRISRRYLLYVGAVALGALLLPRCRAMLKHLLWSPRGEVAPPKGGLPNFFQREGRSLVSIVRGESVDEMVKESVRLIGGLERLDLKGKEVLVKPNVVAGDPPPTTTSPELVKAVVTLLYEAGASKVKVGEMSAFITLPTMRNLEKTGMKQAALAAGAEVIVFDEGPWVEVKHPLAKHVGPFWVAKAVYEAEVFVSLPVIKTHRSASYSLSLKNSIGFIHPRNRPSLYGAKDWEEIVAEVNLALSPHLIIADGLKSMIAGGPWGGEVAETKVLLASGDLVAIDLVGLGLIKSFGRWEKVATLKVWEQRQIKRAVEIGLGARNPEDLEIVSRSLVGEDPAFSGLVEAIRAHIFA